MKEEQSCVFCKIANKEIKVNVIKETKNFLAFPDKNPITLGHTLIIPKKHYMNIFDLPAKLGNELLQLIKDISEMRFKEGSLGINLLMRNGKAAGQEVEHAHVHIVPRRKEDGLKFLPV